MSTRSNKRKSPKKTTVKNKLVSKENSPTNTKFGVLDRVKNSIKTAYGILGVIGTLLGLTAFGFFSPKAEISMTQTVDENDAFATLLEVHNTGEFDMTSVKIDLDAKRIDTWDIVTKQDYASFQNSNVSAKLFARELVRDGEYWTTLIPFKPVIMISDPNVRFKFADVTLVMTYRYLWQDVEKKFHLVGISDNKGKMIWTRQPE